MEKEIDGLNGVYQTIAKITSMEDCLTIYQEFKGLTINFPTKLISVDYIRMYLKKELIQGYQFSSLEIQQLARETEYSERQIRRFLCEVKDELKNEKIEEESLPYLIEWLDEHD